MAKILCRTKGNAAPTGKPRVYFTCHPEDFIRYFDKICSDIFKTHDCAIYYTEDMTAVIEEQSRATDLESINLFIVPVTFRLLTQPNRAMDSDIPFAMEKRIPVLPFMMEPGIDDFYTRKFGELQYLTPYSADLTEISYEEKLKKYLESVLINDELAKRIRAAFDAYIFLSYRKKDRGYANDLMRLIHSHPECRNIAIWYDEFLTPGESFRENIGKILSSSKLFALLVTPNLLEEPDGKPNFVMGEEYPAAKRSGIDILPAEMEKTDRDKLAEKYQGIPACIDPHDEAFRTRLLESVVKIATAENENDPMHNFLIGLAYLEGIDVETDRQRGLALITSAAEAGLVDAMEKLYKMYRDGTYVGISYAEAAKWAERLLEHQMRHDGEAHPDTLLWMGNLAFCYSNLGNPAKAKELLETSYVLGCKVMGGEDPETLALLHNLAVIYGDLGDQEKEREMEAYIYALGCDIWGEEHPDTLLSLNNLAVTCSDLGEHQKAKELLEKGYALGCQVWGEEHDDTLRLQSNLAYAYSNLGEHQKAKELLEAVYTLRCKTLGKEHPHTLTALNNLALTYRDLGEFIKATALLEKGYALRCKIVGENHPDTLAALNNLASAYDDLDDLPKARELHETCYALRCTVMGEEHTDTIASLHDLALACYKLGDFSKAKALLEKGYALRCELLGEAHPSTQRTLANLKFTYRSMGLCQNCGGRFKGLFGKKCSVCGENKDY